MKKSVLDKLQGVFQKDRFQAERTSKVTITLKMNILSFWEECGELVIDAQACTSTDMH